VLDWPADGAIRVPALGPRVTRARVLGGPAISVDSSDGDLVVSVPEGARRPIDTIVRVDFDVAVAGILAR
jgi:hypothetical protein